MILDEISKLPNYENLVSGIDKVYNFCKLHGDKTENGIYSIDGDNVYITVQEYETQEADTILWECHNKYVDIHIVSSGYEYIEWTTRENLTNTNQDFDHDSITSCCECRSTKIKLYPGQFVIFLPSDAHKPKCSSGNPSHVKKFVAKVKLI